MRLPGPRADDAGSGQALPSPASFLAEINQPILTVPRTLEGPEQTTTLEDPLPNFKPYYDTRRDGGGVGVGVGWRVVPERPEAEPHSCSQVLPARAPSALGGERLECVQLERPGRRHLHLQGEAGPHLTPHTRP